MADDSRREVFFETVRIGSMLKCSALDARTGVEVFVVGPLAASPRDLERLALGKLERKLAGAG